MCVVKTHTFWAAGVLLRSKKNTYFFGDVCEEGCPHLLCGYVPKNRCIYTYLLGKHPANKFAGFSRLNFLNFFYDFRKIVVIAHNLCILQPDIRHIIPDIRPNTGNKKGRISSGPDIRYNTTKNIFNTFIILNFHIISPRGPIDMKNAHHVLQIRRGQFFLGPL